LVAFLITPMAVGVYVPGDTLDTVVEPGSESSTTFRVAAGGGQYMSFTRDCDGGVVTRNREDFRDVGAEIQHSFNGTVELGARGGYTEDSRVFAPDPPPATFDPRDWEEKGVYYVNPYFASESDRFGIGAGLIVATGSLNTNYQEDEFRIGNQFEGQNGIHYYPSAHLRFGRNRSTYVSVHFLEGLPLYSGGGALDLGIGARLAPRVDMWFGSTFGGVYDSGGVLLKLRIEVGDRFELQPNARMGFPAGETEYGLGLSLGYRVH